MASSHVKNVCLECSICSDIFKEPKVLPCGHSFCAECLIKVMKRNVSQVEFECPICRKVTDIPSEGFPTNFVLKDIADAAIKNDEIRKNMTSSVKEFNGKVSGICQGMNEKLQKWNKISEVLNVMAAKSFEMTEAVRSMDVEDCEQSMNDIEKMTEIITEIANNFDQLNENRFLFILQNNRDNILIKNTSQFQALAAEFSTISLEEEPIGAVASSQANTTQQETMATRVLAIGGYKCSGGWLNSLEVYNPYSAANNRLLHSKLHDARCNHVSVVIGDTVYVVGGNNKHILKSMELFDPVNHQWLGYGPEMGKERSKFTCAAVQSHLMIFGRTSIGRECDLSFCESFDSITRTWSPLPCTENRRIHHCAVELDGQIYIMGGVINHKQSAALSIFNPDDTTWIFGPSMKQERSLAASSKLDSGIVVTGGFVGFQTLKSCEMLNPREKWMAIASMQQERRGHALVNFNEKLLAMGGYDINGKRCSTVEEYDQRANRWRFVESLMNERVFFAAVTVP